MQSHNQETAIEHLLYFFLKTYCNFYRCKTGHLPHRAVGGMVGLHRDTVQGGHKNNEVKGIGKLTQGL